MYIPLDFNWIDLIGVLPFMFGLGGKKETPTPPPAPAPLPPPVFAPPPEQVTTQQAAAAAELAQIKQLAEAQARQLQQVSQIPQKTAVELQIEQLTLENLQRERERQLAPQPPPQVAKIEPAIAADIYGNLAPNIEKEATEAKKALIGDLSARNLLGSGIEQDILRQLNERKAQRLDEAQRFANTKSIELGLATGDLDLRRTLANQAASQFNIGLGAEVEAKGQQRALERFGAFAGTQDTALNRLLSRQQLGSQEGLQRREQDISIFDTITKRAQEERERKRKTLESVFAPFGEAAGTFGGIALSRAV